MNNQLIGKSLSLLFVASFFIFLFGPLIIMGATAFNSSEFPRVTPWDCFSIEWFQVLMQDQRLMEGLKNSFIIGLGVVFLAVPLGLAGAIMLMQISPRLRPWYYTIVISPILVPGVVLGISTLLFWDRLGKMFDASYESFFYDGIFLTIIGQSTFIAAYAMLVFIARLQRFDPALEEAALDLGATHVQAFRKIQLPFLKPAIASAAVLAFLASFENYNTTVFTVVSESTLTTVLASKVRYGINPSISALAVIIVTLTLLSAILLEIYQRRQRNIQTSKIIGKKTGFWHSKYFATDPALLAVLAVFFAGLGTVYLSGTVGLEECKAHVAERKRLQIEEKIRARKKQEALRQVTPDTTTKMPSNKANSPAIKSSESFENIFAPNNLNKQAGQENKPTAEKEGFKNIFSPENLNNQVDSEENQKNNLKNNSDN